MKYIKVAHRGASGITPENTLIAFSKALEFDVDGVEFDVHGTIDGHCVVIHDDTLDRTTDLKGEVAKTTFDEIRKADAGSWFDPKFAGEKIPTLIEAIDLIKKSAIAVIEIKDLSVSQKTVDAIRKLDAINDVIVISFHESVLREIHKIEPRLQTAFLIGGEKPDDAKSLAIELVKKAREIGTPTINISHKIIDKIFANEVQSHGVNLGAWTIDDVDRLRDLIGCGVQSISTNYPDLFSKI